MIEGLKPGTSEQDPQTWIDALENALLKALKAAKINPSEILSLGVSGQQHGCVPLNDNGIPIRPAKLWNDTSTATEDTQLPKSSGSK
jgi:xylulokinase